MLIVLEVTIVKRASEVPGKIGDPKALNSDAGSERPVPQPQQNGQGGSCGSNQNMTGNF